MNLPKYQRFTPPARLTSKEQVDFCSRVIDQYRSEIPQLRSSTNILKRQKDQAEDEVTYWKEKYNQEKKEKEKLKKENEQLKTEIEKLTKSTKRYQVALFDHGNFKSPMSEGKKEKGGQQGHTDTNRERDEDPQQYPRKRIFSKTCFHCGTGLNRVTATQQKILLDIILNPQMVKFIIESERQWCGNCRKEVSATDIQSLPFSEYGINTFMIVLLLRYRCLLSLAKIAMVMAIGYGLRISESGLVSLLDQSKEYLGKKYEELKTTVRSGEIMYNDETGWQVRGKNVWMWIMASDKATVYYAAESRGKGIAEELYGNSHAYSMHDGLGSYAKAILKEKHLYCWAHLLRFCYEETVDKPPESESVGIRDKLVEIYHLKKDPSFQGNGEELEKEATRRIGKLLKLKTKDGTSLALLHRLKQQRDGLIRALVVSPNGTNNFAEQELRPIALARKISYGSDTFRGMETTAVLASVVQTFARTTPETFFSSLASAIHSGSANS